MAILLTLGAGPLAALMAAERIDLGRARASSRVAPASHTPARAWAAPAGEWIVHFDRNALSLRASADASRVSHSHTTSADQPPARSALSDAASRARWRPFFVRQ